MATTTRQTVSDLEDLFYQSVVDEEFRALLLSDPTLFGLTGASLLLPAPVERLDDSLLNLTSGPHFVACNSTCSFGPFTVVCDGGTK